MSESDDSDAVLDKTGFFAARIEQLVADAREMGLSDEAIAAGLSEAVEALKEGLS